MKALIFDAPRTGYDINQVRVPMTVQELKCLLEDMDDDTIIICGHDDRYTFGTLCCPTLATVSEDGEILMEEELF